MADFVQVNAAGLDVAYTKDDEVRANAVGLQVAYWLTSLTGNVDAHAVGLQVAYVIPTVNPWRIFPVAPDNRRLQSQGMKRVFPV